MKLTQVFLIAVILTATTATTPSRAVVQAEHQHNDRSHTARSHGKLTLNDGKKWHTDEALRHAMSKIHASVKSAVADIQVGKLSSAQYNALGKEITEQLSFIVQNCKLDPKADTQLHLIIAGIADGIDTISAKKESQQRESGIHKIAESLNNYGKYFEHPNWQTLQLSPH